MPLGSGYFHGIYSLGLTWADLTSDLDIDLNLESNSSLNTHVAGLKCVITEDLHITLQPPSNHLMNVFHKESAREGE